MITDEQARAALARWRAHISYEAADSLAQWVTQELARREQHDDGPITEEWLESVGFRRAGSWHYVDIAGDQVSVGFYGFAHIQINGRAIGLDNEGRVVRTYTRRQLLALLAALRGELSENPRQLPAVGPQRAAPSSPAKIEAEARAARGQLNNFGGGR